MEITLSRKNITQYGFIAFAVLALLAVLYAGWTSGKFDQLLRRQEAQPVLPDEPALTTIAAIYAPELEGGQDAWYAQVCEGMNEQGCKLFKSIYGPPIWGALESGAIKPIDAQAVLLDEVETLEDGRQVWKVGFTVLDASEIRETEDVPDPQNISGEIYVEVSRGQETDRWLLDRILFDQEVEARYGA